MKFNNRRSWRGGYWDSASKLPGSVDPPGTRIHLSFATARLRLICPFPRHKHVLQREHMYQKGHLPAILTSIDSSVSLPHDPREIQGMSRITLVKAAIPISGQSQWRTLVHWHYRAGQSWKPGCSGRENLGISSGGRSKGRDQGADSAVWPIRAFQWGAATCPALGASTPCCRWKPRRTRHSDAHPRGHVFETWVRLVLPTDLL